MRQIKVRSV